MQKIGMEPKIDEDEATEVFIPYETSVERLREITYEIAERMAARRAAIKEEVVNADKH